MPNTYAPHDSAVAETIVVDTILATALEAIVIGPHVYLTYLAERPEYTESGVHVVNAVCARIAFPLALLPKARQNLSMALLFAPANAVWPDVTAGHG